MIRKTRGEAPKPAAPPEVAEQARVEAEEKAVRRLQKKSRELQALDLHIAGKPAREIAEELGFSSAREARQVIEAIIDEEKSNRVERIRDLHDMRLSKMLNAHWLASLGINEEGEPVPGGPNQKAGKMVLEIMDQQARLYGVNSPVEIKMRDQQAQLLHVLKGILPAEQFTAVLNELVGSSSPGVPGPAAPRGAVVPSVGGLH